MNNPLHIIKDNDIDWLIKQIKVIVKYFSIDRVTLPIEERSRFNNHIEKKASFKISFEVLPCYL